MSSDRFFSSEQDIACGRLTDFFDANSFNEIGQHMKNNKDEITLVCGYGKILGNPVYAFSQNGSICRSDILKMKKIYHLALKTKTPLVGFYDSYGLDLSEGIELLDQFGELLLWQNKLSGVVPQISVIAGQCISVNAMLACSADFVLMAESASFFTSPTDFNTSAELGSAKSAAKGGVVHIIADDDNIISQVQKLALLVFNTKNLNLEAPTNSADRLRELSKNVTSQDSKLLVENIFDLDSISVFFSEFGVNVLGAIASLDNRTVGVIATNGTSLTADDCVKIAKLVYVWDSLDIPVVTFINTDGMALSDAAASRDFAKVAHVYAQATIPKAAVITGKAYGAGYVSLASRSANSDYTVAWPTAIISPLPPHTSVAFLQGDLIKDYRSRDELEQNYIKGEASALTAAKKGIIDDVINPEDTRKFLINTFDCLADKDMGKIVKKHGNIPF